MQSCIIHHKLSLYEEPVHINVHLHTHAVSHQHQAGSGQELQVMITSNIRMRGKNEISVTLTKAWLLVPDELVWVNLETAELLGFSCTNLSTIYSECNWQPKTGIWRYYRNRFIDIGLWSKCRCIASIGGIYDQTPNITLWTCFTLFLCHWERFYWLCRYRTHNNDTS